MDVRWRRSTLILAGLLVAAIAWGGVQWYRRAQAETMLSAQYQRAFYELLSQVENTEVLLAKSLVAVSAPQQVIHLTDVWRQAFGAQANLNQLPLAGISILRTSRFLTQAGDYAYALARQAARGQALTAGQWEKLDELKRQAGLVARELQDVLTGATEGVVPWQEIARSANRGLSRGETRLQDGFKRLELQLTEAPTLVYDGPYSDHIERREPRGLTGRPITADEAVDIAQRFAFQESGSGSARVVAEVDGPIAAYHVRLEREQGLGQVDLHISRQGGHVVWMLDTRPVAEGTLSLEEAAERARRFLEEQGMPSMEPTWAGKSDNRAIVPLVPVERGVRVYPDLIKVAVALDDGSIVGYEALGFLMSHYDREIPEPRISREEARARLHPALTAGPGRLALIPLETLEEVLTWEFPAELDGDPYVVYINALTGAEEQILKLLTTGEGTLAL
ncbi:MAG: germination protein YpeB [Firmicutes bacterium]|nr:germination protein YpeB [Bacillota bacterium]